MTDPETLPGYFAANVDRRNVARLIDAMNEAAARQERGTVAYDVLEPITEPHNCLRRGCVLVLEAEKSEAATAVLVGREGVVPARAAAPRLAVRERGATVGREGDRRHLYLVRLRDLRAEFEPRGGVVAWPPLMEAQ